MSSCCMVIDNDYFINSLIEENKKLKLCLTVASCFLMTDLYLQKIKNKKVIELIKKVKEDEKIPKVYFSNINTTIYF